ncbi:bifunctional DNA primase/polymerase [Streptacidiphilus sp. PAMC 29251]
MDILFGNPIFSGRSPGPRGRARATRGRQRSARSADEYTQRWGWTVDLAGPELRLVTGLGFDVLDVPEAVGCQALVRLERIGVRPGPVLAGPGGRALFLVAPHTAETLPDLLYKTGWDDAHLDLTCHGAGSSVPAPPTPLTRWLRRPTPETAAQPPEARLLLGPLAYACHRGVAELVGRH